MSLQPNISDTLFNKRSPRSPEEGLLTNRQTDKQTDIATLWPNRPSGPIQWKSLLSFKRFCKVPGLCLTFLPARLLLLTPTLHNSIPSAGQSRNFPRFQERKTGFLGRSSYVKRLITDTTVSNSGIPSYSNFFLVDLSAHLEGHPPLAPVQWWVVLKCWSVEVLKCWSAWMVPRKKQVF